MATKEEVLGKLKAMEPNTVDVWGDEIGALLDEADDGDFYAEAWRALWYGIPMKYNAFIGPSEFDDYKVLYIGEMDSDYNNERYIDDVFPFPTEMEYTFELDLDGDADEEEIAAQKNDIDAIASEWGIELVWGDPDFEQSVLDEIM